MPATCSACSAFPGDGQLRMHILTLTTLFPNARQPFHAPFVRARMENFIRLHGFRWSVVAPVPWFPRLPFRVSGKYDALARVPALEEDRGYPTYHPRYLVTPRVGMRRYGDWMAAGARKTVREIHARHPIDLIDGHYVYPDGTAAVTLGEELGIPVVLSARGTDLNVFPDIPAVRPLIEENLRRCRTLICVSRDLKAKALALGMPEAKIAVIGNGVDAEKFRPGDRSAARKALGLSGEAPIFLSVGNLIEGKGFHLAIEALAGLPDKHALLYIAGQGPMRERLQALAATHGVADRVKLLGPVPNAQLPEWYRAADVFVLATAREGWPNVVTEAQACGLPAVATRVSGIPDIVTDPSLGLLVENRDAKSFQAAMEASLAKPWDRAGIAKAGRARTWEKVSEELLGVFTGAVAGGR
jgi:teichuronic acid biosynthesis glycosyltransferase TuaC